MTEAANNIPERRRTREPKPARESGVTGESGAAATRRPPSATARSARSSRCLSAKRARALTNWSPQPPHTTRAALTGLRKKGHTISKGKVDGVTRYTIIAAAQS